MDSIFQEKLNELLLRWQRLKEEMDLLSADIQKLKAKSETVPEPQADNSEPIDLSLDDFSAAEPEPVPEPVPEQEPEVVLVEPEPEPEPEEDLPENLFGDASDLASEETAPRRRRSSRTVFESSGSGPKAVVDAMAAKAAWRIDMPGPEVRSLRSAIALGDQVVFINRLFRKDSALYQSTIDNLNNTETLSAAVHYLSETFPEWDLESEDVYRFMMAVRRKIRK